MFLRPHEICYFFFSQSSLFSVPIPSSFPVFSAPAASKQLDFFNPERMSLSIRRKSLPCYSDRSILDSRSILRGQCRLWVGGETKQTDAAVTLQKMRAPPGVRVRGCEEAKRFSLCRLKRSELTSSTGVTSFILRLSFPSLPFPTASSLLSPATMALAADTSPTTSDFSEKDVISAGKQDQSRNHNVTSGFRRGNKHMNERGLVFELVQHLDPPIGVLCLSVCFSWLMRGGVAPTAGPISSPSLGRVKWKEMSAAKRTGVRIQVRPGQILRQILRSSSPPGPSPPLSL